MAVGIACFILLAGFAINLPVFISVIGAVLAYFFIAGDASPIIAAQRIIGAAENVTLLAIPYFGVAYWCTTIIGDGGPGWLNLIVLICVWSGLKMLWIGPVSLIHLLRARTSERRARRDHIRRNHDEPVQTGVM